jgi:dihydroorotase
MISLLCGPAQAQSYDLLLKSGHLIDPRNGIDSMMDVALVDGKIARVAIDIPETDAKRALDVTGLIVVPGLIDLHAHLFHGTEPDSAYSNGLNAVAPDGFTFRSGVTTAVDAGGAGWRNFHRFKEQTIDRSRTRVLAFLNIVGAGMKGGPAEQDLNDMDARLTAMRIKQFPDILIGVKVAHYSGPEWDPVDRAVEAGEIAGVPVMIDFGRHIPPLSLSDLLLKHLRPGDFLTHAFAHVDGRMPIVNAEMKVEPFVLEAQRTGRFFDVGHGAGSFLFRQAVPAIKQGFLPDTISTDLHTSSMNAGMKDMLNVMSKFLNMGMTLSDVIFRSTWNPARSVHREDLGHLSVGAPGDVAVLKVRKGRFGFLDIEQKRLIGDQKLECELVLREGRIVWDLNGISGTAWQ